MSTVDVTINCPLAPLPSGKTLAYLKVELVDVTGAVRMQQITAAQIQSIATPGANNSIDIPVQFTLVPAGNYTVRANAVDAGGGALGTQQLSSGNMPANLGASFPQPGSFSFVNT